jgi:hypothetical protein
MTSLKNVFLFAIVAAFMTACSSTKPLTMDMALEKGTNFNYSIATTNNMGMSVMGQDMSTTGKSVQDYNFMVTGVQPTGVTDVDFKITRMTVDQSVPMMGDMSYDSGKDGGDSSSPFASLGGMIGKSMKASFDRKGNVTSIDGADVVMKDVLGKVKGGDQIVKMLEGYLGEESFKNIFMTLTGYSQGKPMKVGDTWSKSVETNTGVTLISDYTYTIRERKDGKVTIDVSGKTKSDPNAKPIEAQGMKITYDLAGPITGVVVVEEKTGWALTSNTDMSLDGKLTMGGTPMGDMKLDAKLKIGVSATRK